VLRALGDMKNPIYAKNHITLSASSINDEKNEAEDSCERIFNYVEINIEKTCKETGKDIERFPCKIQQMPNKQYLAISTLKISWAKEQ
jgi:hypothetical protein